MAASRKEEAKIIADIRAAVDSISSQRLRIFCKIMLGDSFRTAAPSEGTTPGKIKTIFDTFVGVIADDTQEFDTDNTRVFKYHVELKTLRRYPGHWALRARRFLERSHMYSAKEVTIMEWIRQLYKDTDMVDWIAWQKRRCREEGKRDAKKGIYSPPYVLSDFEEDHILNQTYREGFYKQKDALGLDFRWA